MYFISTLLSLSMALVSANGLMIPRGSSCAKGVHIIVARASTEAQGPGMIGAVANEVVKRIPGSDVDSVVYPAVLNPYVESETEGVEVMTSMIHTYAKKCPNSKIVLMGYSQGAQVTSDVLCGTSEKGWNVTDRQPRSITNKIAAVVLMGDPSFTAGQSFNYGTSNGTGIFPRLKPQGCDATANRMMSICDADDLFCNAGGKSLAVHMAYVQNYGNKSADFVVRKYRQARLN